MKDKLLVVIASHNGGDVLRNAVERFYNTAPGHPYDILVVNNGTDDPYCLTYLDDLRASRMAMVEDNESLGYDSGAYRYAINKYVDDYKYFFFTHDDTYPRKSWWGDRMIDGLKYSDVVALTTFHNNWDSEEQFQFVKSLMKKQDVERDTYRGIFGPIFATTSDILKRVRDLGYLNYEVVDKVVTAQGMERGWGYIFGEMGCTVSQMYPEDGPIQLYEHHGDMYDQYITHILIRRS